MKKKITQSEKEAERVAQTEAVWAVVGTISFLLIFILLLVLMSPEIALIITLVGLICLVAYLNMKES